MACWFFQEKSRQPPLPSQNTRSMASLPAMTEKEAAFDDTVEEYVISTKHERKTALFSMTWY